RAGTGLVLLAYRDLDLPGNDAAGKTRVLRPCRSPMEGGERTFGPGRWCTYGTRHYPRRCPDALDQPLAGARRELRCRGAGQGGPEPRQPRPIGQTAVLG